MAEHSGRGVDQPPPPIYAGHGHRRAHQGEHRLPPVLAVLAAIVLYALLPEQLLVGSRYLIPALEVVLLIAVVATNPRRITTETRWSRITSLTLTAVIILSNLFALVLLIHDLTSSHVSGGKSLLVAALQVWATNVIAFALLFWNLDRGGPVSRTYVARDRLPLADFRFSHDEDDDAVIEVAGGSSKTADWIPTFVDYLYLSTTNSSAFSPTDTMPLTSRAKVLMGVEATAALLTSLLVIARAAGALN